METNGQTSRRLYKSRRNKVIDGVCGGIAEYFDVDPTIVRILWILITLMGGSGFILYIVAMIIMPANPEHVVMPQPSSGGSNGTDRRRFFGVMLVLVGAFILFMNVGWIAGFGWWSFSHKIMLPLLLILLGGLLVYIHTTKRNESQSQTGSVATENMSPQTEPVKELRRSKSNRKLFGVCGGIAKYFDIDPTLVRFIFVALIFMSFGWGLLIYIILGIVMPEEKLNTQTS